MLIGKTLFLPETVLTSYDNLEFALRIFIAALLGMLVGIERTRRLKGAGIRTHCIVAMTAAVFMILSKYAFVDLSVGALGVRGADSSRIAAQVVSGISFLGAGIIFKQGKNSIHGLTTAAGMWATAAVGMAIGAGLFWVGITETFILILMQTVLHRFSFGSDVLTEQVLEFRFLGNYEDTNFLLQVLKKHKCIVEDSAMKKDEKYRTMTFRVRAYSPFTTEDVLQIVDEHPEILGITVKEL